MFFKFVTKLRKNAPWPYLLNSQFIFISVFFAFSISGNHVFVQAHYLEVNIFLMLVVLLLQLLLVVAVVVVVLLVLGFVLVSVQ